MAEHLAVSDARRRGMDRRWSSVSGLADRRLQKEAEPLRDMRLKNKVALVTGAGAGIGRAIAERFGSEGAAVVIAEIDRASGESVARSIRNAGGEAAFVQTDVSEETQVKAMTQTALDRYGRIDVLCNNAAVLLFQEEAPAHELSNATW